MFGIFQDTSLPQSERYWTDDALPGTKKNPDVGMLIHNQTTFYQNGGYSSGTRYGKLISTWTSLGEIPLVSSISGPCRTAVSIAHIVNHIRAMGLNSQSRYEHLCEVARGIDHCFTGIVEAVPVFGNIVIVVFVRHKYKTLEKNQVAHQSTHPTLYQNKCTLYAKCGIRVQKNYKQSLDQKLDAARSLLLDQMDAVILLLS